MRAKDHARVWGEATRILIVRKDNMQGKGIPADSIRAAEYLASAVAQAYRYEAAEQEEQDG